jgi:K+-sensing histidine kinase KdpD
MIVCLHSEDRIECPKYSSTKIFKNVLRRGARLTSQMQGDFYAVYVAHPDRLLSKDDALCLEMCQQFCRDFNGEFIRVENSILLRRSPIRLMNI